MCVCVCLGCRVYYFLCCVCVVCVYVLCVLYSQHSVAGGVCGFVWGFCCGFLAVFPTGKC